MRRLCVLATVLILSGCMVGPAKFVIPDEPKFRSSSAYQVEGGFCFADEDIRIISQNIKALKAYADEMRRILEGLRKGE